MSPWAYGAFISYSHAADSRLAPALQSALHRFAKPWNRLRALRTFRDTTNLSVTPHLWPSIVRALSQAEYFVLLASPAAAASKWVRQEVQQWFESRSDANSKLLIVLTEGTICWDDQHRDFDWERTTALPAELRNRCQTQPKHVDLRWARTEVDLSTKNPRFVECIADISATLRSIDKDTLIGEDVRQHRRVRRLIWGGTSSLFLLTTVSILAMLLAFRERNRAEARLEDYRRMADIKLVTDYTEEAAKLWPAIPRLRNGLKEWLLRAEALAQRLKLHRATLQRLRAAELDREQADRAEYQWQYETLAGLVRSLEMFVHADPHIGVLSSVRERLLVANSVYEQTVLRHERDWSLASESIAKSEVYRGLRLRPQLGLVPLGTDPQSSLWEFAVHGSGSTFQRDSDGRLPAREDQPIVLVLLPGGTFRMGASTAGTSNVDLNAYSEEGPPHDVTLEPFFISKYEMTQGQWVRITGRNPSYFRTGSPPLASASSLLHPVENVDWMEASNTARQLGLTLPTEAQLEYATRAGSATVWWTGNSRESLRGAANIADESSLRAGMNWPDAADWEGFDDGYAVHAPVGAFRPNNFGLYDVHGNVWEWCRDRYTAYTSPISDGEGARVAGSETARVSRGGDFMSKAQYARAAFRDKVEESYRYYNLGLRPSRAIEPGAADR